MKLLLILGIPAFFLFLYNAFPGAFSTEEKLYRFIYLFLLLLFVGGGLFFGTRQEVAQKIRHLMIWGCLCLLFITGYSFKDDVLFLGDRVKGELIPSSARETENGAVTVKKALDGHFYLQAMVNGFPIVFLVDTGATGVVLAPHDAQRLGFHADNLTFNKVMHTANGTVRGASIRLQSLAVANIFLDNLPATVNSAAMSESLLGMEFLQRLRGYEVRGDSLFLYP